MPDKGFIFKCTNRSEPECLTRQVFGADRLAADEVVSLQPGDRLFLLNVESNRLIGIFQAESFGKFGLVPEAWNGRYPYQVAVKGLGAIRQLGKGKELLSALGLNSHQLLCEHEVDALNTLFSKSAHEESSGVVSHETTSLVRELARKLELVHRNTGCSVRDEKPLLGSTTLWDYPTQSYGRIPKGDNKYPGVTPAFIIYNLVKRYTAPGDVVLDPMAGSGTTWDVCREECRKAICYDIASVRPEVVENDARSLPLSDNSVDLVFIDSPYGDNIKYNANPNNIGNISAETEVFYDELEKVMKEAHRVLKPGKVLGWLIGDQWVKRQFTPVGFQVYERLTRYFEPVDIICVVRRSQSSNTSVWHNRARRFNFFLRGFKYLIIVRKPDGGKKPDRSSMAMKWAYYDRGGRNYRLMGG